MSSKKAAHAAKFTGTFLYGAAAFIKQYRETGKQATLSLIIAADAPMGLIDSNDVGIFAAHLLSQADISQHNRAKYVLNGPEDITGEQVVKIVESIIGERVEDVKYKDLSMLDYMVSETKGSKNVISSIKDGVVSWWEGQHKAESTSKQVLEIAAPQVTAEQALRAMVEM